MQIVVVRQAQQMTGGWKTRLSTLLVRDCADHLMPSWLEPDQCAAVHVIPDDVTASFWWNYRSLFVNIYSCLVPTAPSADFAQANTLII